MEFYSETTVIRCCLERIREKLAEFFRFIFSLHWSFVHMKSRFWGSFFKIRGIENSEDKLKQCHAKFLLKNDDFFSPKISFRASVKSFTLTDSLEFRNFSHSHRLMINIGGEILNFSCAGLYISHERMEALWLNDWHLLCLNSANIKYYWMTGVNTLSFTSLL